MELDDASEAIVAAYMADKNVDCQHAVNQLLYFGIAVHSVHKIGQPTRLMSADTSFLVKPFSQGSL